VVAAWAAGKGDNRTIPTSITITIGGYYDLFFKKDFFCGGFVSRHHNHVGYGCSITGATLFLLIHFRGMVLWRRIWRGRRIWWRIRRTPGLVEKDTNKNSGLGKPEFLL
jgi:hypothetical protein